MLKLDPITMDYVPIGRRPRNKRNSTLFPEGGRGGKGHRSAGVAVLQQSASLPGECPAWCDWKLIGGRWQCYCD